MLGATVRTVLLCVVMFLPYAIGERSGQCPGKDSPCPENANPCNTYKDCGDQICCTTACGRVCVDRILTGCENLKLSSERIARVLAEESGRSGRGRLSAPRQPKCRDDDGEFEEVQCDHETVTSCWCVDATGFEVPGTRAPASNLVNCKKAAPCAAHTCRMLCPLGFELDNRGCPLCKCRDPCATINCPGHMSCLLEEKLCLRPPCPPLPTCKKGRSLQNICPVSGPLLIAETNRPFLCGTDPGKPNCPPLYRCLVEAGNDYGVCCPASVELQKAGSCPAPDLKEHECGNPCAHDLECPSMQKCCEGGACGKHCILPNNVTMCTQQKMLAELLVVSEREGRGYVPQCGVDGSFISRQCSRNGLVCWCVDAEGNKLKGSMGPSASIKCSATPLPARAGSRSLSACARALCAGICEYGYKTGADGCPTCECDDPCAGYPCQDDEECVRVKDPDCTGDFCSGYPVCRPRVSYDNPCSTGTPLTDSKGAPITCGIDNDCSIGHVCTTIRRSDTSVCCPEDNFDKVTDTETEVALESCGPEGEAFCGLNSTIPCPEGECDNDLVCCSTSTCGQLCIDPAKMKLQNDIVRVDNSINTSSPSMCEYLRDFDEKMEGTVDGMKLALPAPTCNNDGTFMSQQCAGKRCWCVDSYGTEIPDTSTKNTSAIDCDKVRSELSCLDLTCRMACEYGFVLGENRCPTCRCRNPCEGVTCPTGRSCATVEVACDADYCPPVPACLPNKAGQCPFLVPSKGTCEFACRSDSECGAGERCCATGCGTACTAAPHQTPCQQSRALALHTAAESGNPPWSWVPKCTENGAYEKIQCRGADKSCWCVDNLGNEIQGTRTATGEPNCESPSKCPDAGCTEELHCPHGRELDENGCPTCYCKDPCAAKCRVDETCELVPVDCEDENCPSMARCTPSPQCPNGVEPLLAPDNSGPLVCGPSAAACPSTHACRFAPHDSRPSVCCPKPRTVCYENKDAGVCSSGEILNTTRWFFNHQKNRCERFRYYGCSGNHNNFRSKQECNNVCPVDEETVTDPEKKIVETFRDRVLSPCVRLREKNEQAAQKFGKDIFIPSCTHDGSWESVQCMTHINVCWCVSPRGEPLKGSLVRGIRPSCNFRQARKWVRHDPLDERSRADEVLEELIRQMTEDRIDEFESDDDEELDLESRVEGNDEISKDDAFLMTEIVAPKVADTTRKEVPLEVRTNGLKTKCQFMQEEGENSVDGYRPLCLEDGSFAPRQCSSGRCWCVDAAGQRRQQSILDSQSPDPCESTQIESAILELEIVGANSALAEQARTALASKLEALGARVPVAVTKQSSSVRLRTALPGPTAVDIVYHIENLIKQAKLSGAKSGDSVLGADVIRSEYRLAPSPTPSLQQREILSESTVSATTSYHTALIVLAASSAFIISVLCVLVMLYRARLQREPHKAERFLPQAPPIYVLSADEKAELARVFHGPPPPVPPHSEIDNSRV